MRLNDKTAKELRGAAKYKNQSKTPSSPTFPGVARIYSSPVYQTRSTLKSSYQRKNGEVVRVVQKVRVMAVVAERHGRGLPQIEMAEHAYPATVKREDGTEVPHPRAGQKYWGPKLEMLPVTKPVKATAEKAIYRQLKRLHKKGLLKIGGGLTTLAKSFDQSKLSTGAQA